MTVRSMVAALAALMLFTLSACSSQDPDDFLKPLADLAREAITEADGRVDKAATLLQGDVASAPQIARLLGTATDAEDVPMNWDNSPYIAAGVVNGAGELIGMFPHASNGFTELLAEAAKGARIGDLKIIPNTFSFTMSLSHTPEGSDRSLGALIDVDKVLLDGVLKPVAGAAGGYAFLANRDQRVILATHPALVGQPLSKWNLPVPLPGENAVAEVNVAGVESYIATAASSTPNGWILGVTVPVTDK